MKLVIYRNKQTNEITMFHDWKANMTDDLLERYNENENNATKAEIIDLEKDSIAYYFYTMKTKQIERDADDLRDLQDTLEDIAERIQDRLDAFDKWLEERKGE